MRTTHTFSLAVLLIAFSLVGSIGTIPASPCQTAEQGIELFKVSYGKRPHQLDMRLRPFPSPGEDNEGNSDSDYNYGGVGSFCVSWDGQLFYFADLKRGETLDENPESFADDSPSELENPPPWVQVYKRDGRWVRTVRIIKGNPFRMRVDAAGRLYLQGDDGVEVYDADGEYNKSLSERFRSVVRAAREQYNLADYVYFLEVDAQGRVYFKVFPILAREGGRTLISGNKVLVAYPDGSSSLLSIEDYNPFGIDRYRGQIITANYTRPLLDNFLRSHETTVIDANTSEQVQAYNCDLYRTLPYKVIDHEGQTLRTFEWRVDISELIPNYWDAYNLSYNTGSYLSVAVDGQGHLYRVYLRPQIQRLIVTDPGFKSYIYVYRGFGIFEFTAEGTLVRPRLLDVALDAQFRCGNLWDVDRDGNVYWVEFHGDHLRVRMSPKR